MSARPKVTVVVAVALLAACASNPPPVPLQAGSDDMSLLRGEWRGRYWSDQTGRHGSIRFELTAAGDTARGDVVMVPADRDARLVPVGIEDEPDVSAPSSGPSFLTIHFVRSEEGRLQGTLDAYEDPETGHPLVTTFRGEITGDSIGGTFTSYDRIAERRAEGTWFVRRR